MVRNFFLSHRNIFFWFFISEFFLADPTTPFKADVRMIDFAHVFPINDNGIDDGYVKGLQSIVKSFKRYEYLSFLYSLKQIFETKEGSRWTRTILF